MKSAKVISPMQRWPSSTHASERCRVRTITDGCGCARPTIAGASMPYPARPTSIARASAASSKPSDALFKRTQREGRRPLVSPRFDDGRGFVVVHGGKQPTHAAFRYTYAQARASWGLTNAEKMRQRLLELFPEFVNDPRLPPAPRSAPAKCEHVKCGAQTRRKTACQRKALANGRCPNHGGLSTDRKPPMVAVEFQRYNALAGSAGARSGKQADSYELRAR